MRRGFANLSVTSLQSRVQPVRISWLERARTRKHYFSEIRDEHKSAVRPQVPLSPAGITSSRVGCSLRELLIHAAQQVSQLLLEGACWEGKSRSVSLLCRYAVILT